MWFVRISLRNSELSDQAELKSAFNRYMVQLLKC